jgi:hypothetical protein
MLKFKIANILIIPQTIIKFVEGLQYLEKKLWTIFSI